MATIPGPLPVHVKRLLVGVFKAATANNLVRERLKNGSIEAVEGFDMTCFDRYCLFFDHASPNDVHTSPTVLHT